MTASAIVTSGLTRVFGKKTAVDQLQLNVEVGTMYGFLGPNGAGKSTTIKMLTGILAPTSGSIRLLGLDPWNPDECLKIRQRTGVVPEGLALFDHLTAREYLLFVGRMYQLPLKAIKDRTEELLSVLSLEDVETKLTLEYSHGMRKKLALAASLLPNPELLFLDEPFEGVDAVSSRVIRDLLKAYVERGSTVFITSHVLEIVEKLCTHVGIIAAGRLVLQSSLDQLRSGATLEQRFLEVAGPAEGDRPGLTWLSSESAKATAP